MDDRKPFAFVFMPFDAEFEDRYKFGIKEPAEALDVIAERVDEQIYSEGILERIYRQIDLADLIIADMTNQNPNVFYEVGYAHAKEKLCVLLTSKAEDIPFDLKHRRHVVYSGSINILKERITEELKWACGEISNIRDGRIKVTLKAASGELERSGYVAKGLVNFEIDLRNNSSAPSAEIEAAYFYSTGPWTLYQDDKVCSSTESDIESFNKRHFLSLPLRKLQRKNGWAQLRFRAEKILAYAVKGQEIKNSYRIHGWSVLRLVTSEGDLDYQIPIDVTVDEIPF